MRCFDPCAQREKVRFECSFDEMDTDSPFLVRLQYSIIGHDLHESRSLNDRDRDKGNRNCKDEEAERGRGLASGHNGDATLFERGAAIGE